MWQPTLHLPVVPLRALTARHTTYITNLALPRLPKTRDEDCSQIHSFLSNVGHSLSLPIENSVPCGVLPIKYLRCKM